MKGDRNMSKYKAENFYMLRTPLFSFNFYKHIFSGDEKQDENILNLINNNMFIEAISIASPDLISSIEDINFSKNSKNLEKIKKSLIKYIIRSSTRTTPFGLFCGIDIGTFDSQTNTLIDSTSKHKKRARADMEWIYNLINILENDNEIIKNIKVKFNSTYYLKGDRIINPSIGCNSVDNNNSNIIASVRCTNQVKFVESLSKEFIYFKDLSNAMKHSNPNINEKTIELFLKNLLKNQYLISELRMPLCNIDPLDYILSIIENIEEAKKYTSILTNLKEMIKDYNNLELGFGLQKFKEICSLMETISKCKNYLQVDLKSKFINNTLNNSIKEEMEKTSTKIIELSKFIPEPDYLEKYKEEFIEKYGPYIEVPVLELLDPDIGLGAPASYKNPLSNKVQSPMVECKIVKTIKKFIINKICSLNINNEKEIILTDDDLERIMNVNSSENRENTPVSFDMNFLIFNDDKKDNDFRLSIAPNIGANSAGRMFGRFTDMFSEHQKSYIYGLYETKKALLDNEILVEAFETPQSGRLSNICLNSNNIKYQIAIGAINNKCVQVIKPDDIYVGFDSVNKKLYLKSRTLDRKIVLNISHMLNPISNSNLYRFLREVSDWCNSNFISFMHSLEFQELDYTPRIVYSKTILSPANWKLSLDILNCNNSFYEFKNAFNSWKEKYNLPRYVYHKVLDNRLLFDLKNYRHIEEIFNLIKNPKDTIKLFESEGNPNNSYVKNRNKDNFFAEVIVPFSRVSKEKREIPTNLSLNNILNTKSNISMNSSKVNISSKERILLPGDEDWWYYNIYCSDNSVIDDLIADEISTICEELLNKKIIKKYFFMRYADPDVHIRLRIQVDHDNINLNRILEINNWLSILKEKNKIKKVTLGTYEREIERYGGIELIRIAEELFYYDSKYVLSLLKEKKNGNLNVSDEEIALISLDSIMSGFDLDIVDKEVLLSEKFSQKEYRKEFNKYRNNFMNKVDISSDDDLLRNLDFNKEVYRSLIIRNEYLRSYYNKIIEIDSKGNLTNTKLDILFSIMHMFCNRYKANTIWEVKVMTLLRHSIYSLKQKKSRYSYEKNK